MADLAKLKELVAHAEAVETEVSEREKDRDRLEQACVTLNARVQHLKDTINTAETELANVRAEHAAAVQAREQSLEAVQQEARALRLDIDAMNTQMAADRATHLAWQESCAKAAEQTNAELASLEQSYTETLTTKQAVEDELASLTQKRGELKDELADLAVTVEMAHAEAKSARAQSHEQIAAAADEYADVNQQVTEARKLLKGLQTEVKASEAKRDQATRTHKDFVQYESRATKALEAREIALLDREEEVAKDLSRARRRNTVLDKVD